MENTGEKTISTNLSASAHRMAPVSTMAKEYVYNETNEEIGSIKEIMIDVPKGRIAYAVLGVGGFLGLGEHLFAIPWEALAFDADRGCFRLHASKERLKNAPGFDKNHWPDTADPSWGQANEYWGGPLAASGVPGNSGDDLGVKAGRRYDRETAGYPDKDVDEKAREARRAIDSEEGPSLRAAEQVGKSRARD